MGNYYRSGYQLSRRQRTAGVISMVLITASMILGMVFGFSIGYVGRQTLNNQIEAQQAVIEKLTEELETRALFGHPRQMNAREV